MFKNKWVIFGFVMLVGVASDQVTKLYAEARLASRHLEHEVVLEVDDAHAGATLEAFLRDELAWSTDAEVERVAQRFVVGAEGQRLQPSSTLSAGQQVRLLDRNATVVDDHLHLFYARNPGAAWSFLADAPEGFRKAFFRIMSTLALGLLIFMIARAEVGQRRYVWALSLVASGAVGNLIDRFFYGYVIDFIRWEVTDSYTWPTFNLADVWIAIGVGLMFIELFAMNRSEHKKLAAEGGAGAAAAPAASPAGEGKPAASAE